MDVTLEVGEIGVDWGSAVCVFVDDDDPVDVKGEELVDEDGSAPGELVEDKFGDGELGDIVVSTLDEPLPGKLPVGVELGCDSGGGTTDKVVGEELADVVAATSDGPPSP